MSVVRRSDLHLEALQRLTGQSAVVLFPDGWYGRPHDHAFVIGEVVISSDPVTMAIRDFGSLRIERDCAVLEIASKLVAVRLIGGMTRCFDGDVKRYGRGFLSFVTDKALSSPFVDLHFFMSGAGRWVGEKG